MRTCSTQALAHGPRWPPPHLSMVCQPRRCQNSTSLSSRAVPSTVFIQVLSVYSTLQPACGRLPRSASPAAISLPPPSRDWSCLLGAAATLVWHALFQLQAISSGNCFQPNTVSMQAASALSTFSMQAAVHLRHLHLHLHHHLHLQPPPPPLPPRCPSPCVRTTAAPAAALAAMQSTTLAIAALTAFILLQTSAPISLNQSAGPVLPTTFAPWAHLSQRHAPMDPFPQQAPRAAYQGAPVRRAMSSRLLLGAALPPSFSFTQASS